MLLEPESYGIRKADTMIRRFAITHVHTDGYRKLTFANQGRNMYDTRSAAQEALEAYKPDLRAKVIGDAADTLEVSEVECYDNGDAVGLYAHNLN